MQEGERFFALKRVADLILSELYMENGEMHDQSFLISVIIVSLVIHTTPLKLHKNNCILNSTTRL